MKIFLLIFLCVLPTFAAVEEESEALRAFRLACEKQRVGLGCFNYANMLIRSNKADDSEKYFEKGCKLGHSPSCQQEKWDLPERKESFANLIPEPRKMVEPSEPGADTSITTSKTSFSLPKDPPPLSDIDEVSDSDVSNSSTMNVVTETMPSTDSLVEAPTTGVDNEEPSKADMGTEIPSKTDAVAEAPAKTDTTAEAPAKADTTAEAPAKTDTTAEAPAKTDATAEAPAKTDTTAEAPAKADATSEKPVNTEAVAESSPADTGLNSHPEPMAGTAPASVSEEVPATEMPSPEAIDFNL